MPYIDHHNPLTMTANRKAAALKALQGSDRPSRDLQPVLKKLPEKPRPVFTLSDAELQIYENLIEHLSEYQLLHTVDSIGLSAMAKNIAIMRWCAEELEGIDDVIQVFENGTSNVSGLYTAYTKALQSFQSMMGKWGLSPVDREKIAGMVIGHDQDDVYEKLKQQ